MYISSFPNSVLISGCYLDAVKFTIDVQNLFNIIVFLHAKLSTFIQQRCDCDFCDPVLKLRDVSVNCWELSFATTKAPGHHANEFVVVYQRVARIPLTRSSMFAAGTEHALCDRVPNTFVEVFAVVEVDNSD